MQVKSNSAKLRASTLSNLVIVSDSISSNTLKPWRRDKQVLNV